MFNNLLLPKNPHQDLLSEVKGNDALSENYTEQDDFEMNPIQEKQRNDDECIIKSLNSSETHSKT